MFIDNDGGTSSVVSIAAGQTFNIDSLTINSGDTLNMEDASNFGIIFSGVRAASGQIHNSGLINLNSGGSFTNLVFDNGTFTIDGGGVISLNHQFARMIDTIGSANGNLTNVDNTIQGRGEIGANTLQLTNQAAGLFHANVSGGTLVVDPRTSTTMVNQGTMRAGGGGILNLTGNGGGGFDNTGGVIEALGGSFVTLTSGAAVTGGTLQTTGSGEIRVVSGQTATFSGLSTSGIVRVQDASSLNLAGTISNSGTIHLDSGGSFTNLVFDNGSHTIAGGGVISLNHQFTRMIDTVGSANGNLTNVDNTIQGRGEVGANTLQLTNQAAGLIHANVSGGTLVVDPRTSTTMVNQGTMRASGGGILNLTGNGGGNFDNRLGVIEALNNSFVNLSSSADVFGGTLQTTFRRVLPTPDRCWWTVPRRH